MELNSKKRISINVIFSILQVVIVGLIYLIIYKLLLSKLGVERLGIWSLILATTSVANIANFGITSGIVKFVAEYYAEDKIKKVEKVIFTSFLSILISPSLPHPHSRDLHHGVGRDARHRRRVREGAALRPGRRHLVAAGGVREQGRRAAEGR